MSRKLLIAAALIATGTLGVLVFSRGQLPLYGAGAVVEILYFFLAAYLCWVVQAPAVARVASILVATVVVAVVGAYLSSAAFAKVDFDIRVMAVDFVLHVLAVIAFLGLVCLLDRAIPGAGGSHGARSA